MQFFSAFMPLMIIVTLHPKNAVCKSLTGNHIKNLVHQSLGKTQNAVLDLDDLPIKSKNNKWRGVTISLRTGGQGHPTPIHTPTHPQHSNIHKKYRKRLFSHFSTCALRTDGPTDQRMDKASYRVACPQLKSKQTRPAIDASGMCLCVY